MYLSEADSLRQHYPHGLKSTLTAYLLSLCSVYDMETEEGSHVTKAANQMESRRRYITDKFPMGKMNSALQTPVVPELRTTKMEPLNQKAKMLSMNISELLSRKVVWFAPCQHARGTLPHGHEHFRQPASPSWFYPVLALVRWERNTLCLEWGLGEGQGQQPWDYLSKREGLLLPGWRKNILYCFQKKCSFPTWSGCGGTEASGCLAQGQGCFFQSRPLQKQALWAGARADVHGTSLYPDGVQGLTERVGWPPTLQGWAKSRTLEDPALQSQAAGLVVTEPS